MTVMPVEGLLDALADAGCRPRRSGSGWAFFCPAHDDRRNPSATLHKGDDGRALVHCHAACAPEAILAAVHLSLADLFPDQGSNGSGRPPEPEGIGPEELAELERYLFQAAARLAEETPLAFLARDYVGRRYGLTAEDLEALGLGVDSGANVVTRPECFPYSGPARLLVPLRDVEGHLAGCQGRALTDHHIRWVTPRGSGWGRYGTFGWERPGPVVLTEGLSDALAAFGAGFATVGIRGAALSADAELTEALSGRMVVVAGQDDDPGRRFAERVAGVLAGAGVKAGRLEVPGGHGDLAAWCEALGPEEFRAEAYNVVGSVEVAQVRLPDPPPSGEPAHDPEMEKERPGAALAAGGGWGGPLAPEARTDDANAARFAATAGDRFRWAKALGWLAWDNTRWAADERETAVAAASLVGHAVIAEAVLLLGEKGAKQLLAWGAQSLNATKIEALLRLARPRLAVTVDELDRDPWLLNVRNGTLDLRTGDLGPHRREDLITKLAPVEYHAGAAAPTWERFLAEVVPAPEVRAFLRRLVGCGLIGEVREQVLPILYGGGANGKSTFVETLLGVLGDYALAANRELLTADDRGSGEHPTQLAQLRKVRLVGSIEIEDGRRLSEAVVKQLTGGDTVRARFMRRDHFSITPTWLILYAVNHKPVVRGTDHAIWRRLLLIPFTVTIRDGDQDPDLKAKLAAEAAGILAWAVAGCQEYQRDGLAPPEAVRLATSNYRDEEDTLGQFLAERCFADPHVSISFSALHDAAVKWCGVNHCEAWTSTQLGRLLTERGYPSVTPTSGMNRNTRMREGLALRVNDEGKDR